MPARPGPQKAKAILGIMVRDALDETGKNLLRLILGRVFHGRCGGITSCTHAILLKPATGRQHRARDLASRLKLFQRNPDSAVCSMSNVASTPHSGRAIEWGVLVQRWMAPRLTKVGSIHACDSAQGRLTEHDHVAQAFPADRAEEPLDICICHGDRGTIDPELPWRADAARRLAAPYGKQRPGQTGRRSRLIASIPVSLPSIDYFATLTYLPLTTLRIAVLPVPSRTSCMVISRATPGNIAAGSSSSDGTDGMPMGPLVRPIQFCATR